MEITQGNPGKELVRQVGEARYLRIPIRTHLITEEDEIEQVAWRYAGGLVRPGDVLFLSEKAVACTQGRAIPLERIRPSRLAAFLSRFVTKTPAGIGLGMPETMEMALRECGAPRILLAAVLGGAGKLLGRWGWFYRVAGPRARGIDGPCGCTIPPYHRHVVLAPAHPERVAGRVSRRLGVPAAVVDINDLGANILAVSPGGPDPAWLEEALRDNPLGQSREQTPLGILRREEA